MRALVRKAIAEALTDSSPQGHPFLVLREAGVVAQIRSAIRQRLADLGQGRCRGRLVARAKKPRYLWGPEEAPTDEVLLDRVQMELKLSADLAAWNPGDRLDLLVLADTVVELTCWNNGPGDVVASVPSSCVQAAIEVKAAPSVDPEQVLRFGQDLDKLLRFLSLPAPSKGACAFFVLLDKSSLWFGRWDVSVKSLEDRRVDWSSVKGLDDLLKGPPQNATVDAARNRLKALGIRLQDEPEPHAPCVELVVLGESQALYAVRSH